MSTWISRILFAAAGLALAACSGGIDVGRRSAPEVVSVAGRSVAVAGPPGFCIDPSARRDGEESFVLLGSCASIARDPDGATPEIPGLMTVVVSSEGEAITDIAGRADILSTFFRSAAGRAALSRSGRAETVEVFDIRRDGRALFIRARDTSATPLSGMSQEYWRALLDVNGRLVTVSLIGFEDRPISPEDGLRLVRTAAERIAAESARLSG